MYQLVVHNIFHIKSYVISFTDIKTVPYRRGWGRQISKVRTSSCEITNEPYMRSNCEKLSIFLDGSSG